LGIRFASFLGAILDVSLVFVMLYLAGDHVAQQAKSVVHEKVLR
jgi:hypothetical protein